MLTIGSAESVRGAVGDHSRQLNRLPGLGAKGKKFQIGRAAEQTILVGKAHLALQNERGDIRRTHKAAPDLPGNRLALVKSGWTVENGRDRPADARPDADGDVGWRGLSLELNRELEVNGAGAECAGREGQPVSVLRRRGREGRSCERRLRPADAGGHRGRIANAFHPTWARHHSAT